MKSSNHLTAGNTLCLCVCVCVSGNSSSALHCEGNIYCISDLSGLFRPIYLDNLICVSYIKAGCRAKRFKPAGPERK